MNWFLMKRAARHRLLAATRYPLEWIVTLLFQAGAVLLPLQTGTALAGRVAKRIGPRLRRSEIARRNLRRAMPELETAEIERIVRDMWEHMGRSTLEYARLRAFAPGSGDAVSTDLVTVEGIEHIDALRADGRPGLIFSGHLGNWELLTLLAKARGLEPLFVVYRPANNPMLDRLIRGLQGGSDATLIRKGPTGARELLAALRQGGHVIMLVDQKMNDGIPVPFFGRDAMTAPALAQLALRFEAPVVPVQTIRLRGPDGHFEARFRIVVHPPLDLPDTGDRHADIEEVMRRVNTLLERWIRDYPEQWLWMHRRWPD